MSMRHIFDINEEVTIVNDLSYYFTGSKGIIRNIEVVGVNTVYGVEIIEGPYFNYFDSSDECILCYFLAIEIQ